MSRSASTSITLFDLNLQSGTIAKPEPTTFRLPLWHFETLPPPEAFDHPQTDRQPAWPSKAWMRR